MISQPRRTWQYGWLRGFAVTFVWYVASGWLGVMLLDQLARREEANASTALAVLWLAPGFGVAGLLRYGVRAWPAVFAGSIVVWGVIQRSYFPLTVIESVGEALSIILIVALLRVWSFRPTLDRYKDSLLLVAAVAIGRSVSSAIDAISVIATAWVTTDSRVLAGLAAVGVVRRADTLFMGSELLRFSARWWANTVAGCLLIVPLLALRPANLRSLRHDLHVELSLLALFVAVWIAGAITLLPGVLRPGLLLAALIPVIWAAVRFGVGIAALVTLAFSMTAAAGFGLQLGTFAGLGARERLEVAWGFIGLLLTTALFLTALLSQRVRSRRAIANSAERYRRLFAGNPFPMWTEDPASGRILLANPAMLQLYGYTESELPSIFGRDLRADGDAPPQSRWDRSVATVEQHRTRAAAAIVVEVTRATIAMGGRSVHVCFVEPLTERHELRLALLSAGDIERFRLGAQIGDQLLPLLTRVVTLADLMKSSPSPDGQSQDDRLAAIRTDVRAATSVCAGLTRGASPLQWAAGDLVEALRRLPAALPDQRPPVEVSIRCRAPLRLSVERRDHVYRLAEDAARWAIARPGTSAVHVTLEVDEADVRLRIDQDERPSQARPSRPDIALRSMNARAVAAQGRLSVSQNPGGGTTIGFECEQQEENTVPKTATATPPVAGLLESDEPRPRERTAEPPLATTAAWLRQCALLVIAYLAAGVPSVKFLMGIDPAHLWFGPLFAMPWVPIGVALIGVLLGGQRLAPAVFVGALCLWRFFAHDGWIPSLANAAGEAAAVVIMFQTLNRFEFRRSCDRSRDLLLLIGVAIVGQLVILAVDSVGLELAAVFAPGSMTGEMRDVFGVGRMTGLAISKSVLEGAYHWWLAGLAGIALTVPTALSWSLASWTSIRARLGELIAWLAALGAVAAAIVGGGATDLRLPILALGLTVVTWAAVRFGVAIASTGTLLLSMVASVGFGLGVGILARTDPEEGVGVLWTFIVLLTATAQLITTLLAESDHAEDELRQLQTRYSGLFEAVPHPLFAISSADTRLHLANEEATRRYGYSTHEFAGMTLGDLDADHESRRMDPAALTSSRLAARHRTKSGALLDVELALTTVELDDEPGVLCFAVDVTERNRLRTRMIEATDRERRRLARDFHDGLGQVLTGLQLGMEPLLRSGERRLPLDRETIEFIAQASREALQTCQEVLLGVSPLRQTGGDLVRALTTLPDRLPPGSRDRLAVSLSVTHSVTLPIERREHLYQIAQEAVNNSLKHAQATQISVELSVSTADITLVIEDNGTGFDPTHRSAGLGLESLSLRAAALNGVLRILRRPGGGTVVKLVCPQGSFEASDR